MFWIGLFAVVGRGSLRWVVVFLFHAATILVLLVTTYAYYYFQQTGATLEYGHIMVLISEFDEIVPILARTVPLLIWALFVGGLFSLRRALAKNNKEAGLDLMT